MSDKDIDVDLTAMSDTVMYSTVIAMAEKPEEYTGKTVRMTGDFASMYGVTFCTLKNAVIL